jgi:hypothetical protein
MSASTLYLQSTSQTSDAFVASEYNSLSTAPVCRIKVAPPLPIGAPPPPPGAVQATSQVMYRGAEDTQHAVTVTIDPVAPYLQRNMTNIPKFANGACQRRYLPQYSLPSDLAGK